MPAQLWLSDLPAAVSSAVVFVRRRRATTVGTNSTSRPVKPFSGRARHDGFYEPNVDSVRFVFAQQLKQVASADGACK
jgi:hypothetical protein